jgi:tetratricopeptide (TPR) repeat protein
MSKPDPGNAGDEDAIIPVASNVEATADDVALVASKPLTYFNTKNGPFYTKAKEILQTDDFEAALSMIETGLTTILSMLPGQDNHEALGPLYYMYGTTLLYSVEESQDTAEASVMAQDAAEQTAGDLEIAWENLETARSILTKLKCNGAEDEERALDLAQIHCRLADLSRHNGHYEQAIQDYESCCEGRRRHLTDVKLWDRRIADVEYSLGMASLLLAAEGEKNLMDKEDKDDDKDAHQNPTIAAMVASTGTSASDNEKVVLSPEQITASREKSTRHYVQCARILAGIIACKSNANPIEMSAADESLENNENKKCSSKEAMSRDATSVQEKASTALNIIRGRISKLKPSNAEDAGLIHDLTEMLDEIQETVDNCETDREGLRDVNKMRKKAEDDIKNADAMGATFASTNEAQSEESTTTIGFGAAVATAGMTIIGDAASTSTSQEVGKKPMAPMMMVKKKKKRDTIDQNDCKRAKTTERGTI